MDSLLIQTTNGKTIISQHVQYIWIHRYTSTVYPGNHRYKQSYTHSNKWIKQQKYFATFTKCFAY